MVSLILPWQEARWQRITRQLEDLPHALLLAGPGGQGKGQFAAALAALLLCDTPAAGPAPCGHCTGCQWRLADNHPDLLRIVPEAEEEGTGEPGEASKGKSAQILIAQVRALQEALTITAHRGGRRVVILDPAEAMNPFTANALLKLLEEPPKGVIFLLISAQPQLLLPTLRSRCQRWDFPLPPADVVLPWLSREHPDTPAALLALVGGAPLGAVALASAGGEALRQRFVGDLAGLTVAGALGLAGRWESWVKSKDGQAAGLDLPTLIAWFQRWVTDLSALRLGGQARFFPDQAGLLRTLAGAMSTASARACYNDGLAFRRVARHSLNSRLLLEDMLLRYVRALQGGAP